MQRVNGHQFYDLATKIHPLSQIPDDASQQPIMHWFFGLWNAREAVKAILSKMPLRVCSAPARKLIDAINSIIPEDPNQATPLFRSTDALGYGIFSVRNYAQEFQTVLEAELQSLDTYLVSQKGTHSTPDLIERADITFPENIRRGLPPQAIQDVRQAGRCLALDNPTASAFHILRAVEAVMAKYFELVTGGPLPTRMRNWGIYLNKLKKHPDASQKVIGFLDHIRENYRNPILHPEVFMAEDEAEALLGAATSAMRMLVLEIRTIEAKSLSLPLLAELESLAEETAAHSDAAGRNGAL